jgi:hypothetical protein
VALLVDYFGAVGRGLLAVVLWLLRLVAWVAGVALLAVLALATLRLVTWNPPLGFVVVVVEALAAGFVVFVLRRRHVDAFAAEGSAADREPVDYEDGRQELRSIPFVFKVVLGCIIVVLFFKYVVQIRLEPIVNESS